MMETEIDDFDTPSATQSKDLLSLYSNYLAKLDRSPVTIRTYLENLKLFSRWFTEEAEILGSKIGF